MNKSVGKMAALALIVGGTAALLSSGCKNPEQQADDAAAEKIQTAEQNWARASTLEDIDAVQNQYDSIAHLAGLSKELSVIVHARNAALQFQAAQMRMGDLRGLELEISGEINNLEQIGQHLATAQSSIIAIKATDPTKTVDSLSARIVEIRGDKGNPNWSIGDDPNLTMPTEAKLAQTIKDLTDQIASSKTEIDQNRKTSNESQQKADALTRQSEGEAGDDQVRDLTQASDLRKTASLADSHADTLTARVGKLSAQLDVAQANKDSVDSNLAALQNQIDGLKAGWTAMGQQIDQQQKLQQQLIGDDPSYDNDANPAKTISQRAHRLGDLLNQASDLRDKINQQLQSASDEFSTAALHAQAIRADVQKRRPSGGGVDPDQPIWQQKLETLNPDYFNLQEAAAKESEAIVAAGATGIETMMKRMLDGMTLDAATITAQFPDVKLSMPDQGLIIPGLLTLLNPDATGVPTPKSVTDLANPDDSQISQERDEVDKKFAEALDSFQQGAATDSGTAAKIRMNGMFVGRAIAYRQWAQFALMVGDADAAKKDLDQAADAEKQVDPDYNNVAGVSSPAGATGSSNN